MSKCTALGTRSLQLDPAIPNPTLPRSGLFPIFTSSLSRLIVDDNPSVTWVTGSPFKPRTRRRTKGRRVTYLDQPGYYDRTCSLPLVALYLQFVSVGLIESRGFGIRFVGEPVLGVGSPDLEQISARDEKRALLFFSFFPFFKFPLRSVPSSGPFRLFSLSPCTSRKNSGKFLLTSI